MDSSIDNLPESFGGLTRVDPPGPHPPVQRSPPLPGQDRPGQVRQDLRRLPAVDHIPTPRKVPQRSVSFYGQPGPPVQHRQPRGAARLQDVLDLRRGPAPVPGLHQLPQGLPTNLLQGLPHPVQGEQAVLPHRDPGLGPGVSANQPSPPCTSTGRSTTSRRRSSSGGPPCTSRSWSCSRSSNGRS